MNYIQDLSERLKKDLSDNTHMTRNPMFCLQIAERIVGLDTVMTDTRCWYFPELAETLFDDDDYSTKCSMLGLDPSRQIDLSQIDQLEREIERASAEESKPVAGPFGYVDQWVTIMVALSEEGLKDYMKADGHNVRARAFRGKTRVYVDTFGRCEEMVNVRKHLIGLHEKDI